MQTTHTEEKERQEIEKGREGEKSWNDPLSYMVWKNTEMTAFANFSLVLQTTNKIATSQGGKPTWPHHSTGDFRIKGAKCSFLQNTVLSGVLLFLILQSRTILTNVAKHLGKKIPVHHCTDSLSHRDLLFWNEVNQEPLMTYAAFFNKQGTYLCTSPKCIAPLLLVSYPHKYDNLISNISTYQSVVNRFSLSKQGIIMVELHSVLVLEET